MGMWGELLTDASSVGMRALRLAALGAAVFAFLVGPRALAQEPAQIREAQAIAEEAYLYGFPMIVNYKNVYAGCGFDAACSMVP
jgi:hypothetical protein